MSAVPRPPAPGPLSLSTRVLLGPGPSDVHPRVLAAMGMPLVGHLDPEFVALMDETQDLLRYVFQTKNRLTLAVSGTGSAGMETVVVNLIEPGDRMLVCVNGVFGARMQDVAERAGAEVTAIERPYGEVFDPDEVKAAVERVRPKVVGIVHAETSTGAWQPVEEIARIAHEAGRPDRARHRDLAGRESRSRSTRWEIDAVYSGTQKCLSCPPGLAPVSFGPRAVEALEPAQDEGPELVPRPDDDPALLGKRPVLSPHRADQHELRAARGARAGRRGGAGGPHRPARAQRPGAARRPGRDGPEPRDRRRPPPAPVDLRPDPRRDRRPGGPPTRCSRTGASRSAAASARSRARPGGSG